MTLTRPPATTYSWGMRESTMLVLSLMLTAALAVTLWAGVAQATPQTFTVDTTADPGDGTCDASGCTLREAIVAANANSNPAETDVIEFGIPASDTGCDAGGDCTISPGSSMPEITQSVTIDGYTQAGASPNNLAEGNDAELQVQLSGAAAGTGADGIRISGPDSVVRGLIVNRWSANGIVITGPDASGNAVVGNFVGTDASGTEDLGNGVRGVDIDGASLNAVGGVSAGARNVISGNVRAGVHITGREAISNTVEGNYVGTDASGTETLGNAASGVFVSNARNNTVGGTSAGAGNVVSGNGTNGVVVTGSGNKIEGNYVGTDRTATADLGNVGDGVVLDGQDNVVGGASADAGNVISGNDNRGVHVVNSDTTGNSLLRNSISDNGGLGIDLSGGTQDENRVTTNDPGDADTGPNNLQNYPSLSSVVATSGRTAIQGDLNSSSNTTYKLQFFASPTMDPSGSGEGETYVGQTTVTTDVAGNASFSTSIDLPISVGQFVAATATNNVTDDTSEFSRAREVEDQTPPDSTAPRVVSVSPRGGTTGVSPSTNVTATFSEAMDPTTISSATFKLFRGTVSSQNRVAAKVQYDAANRRAVLDPEAPLARGTRYLARVTTGAEDLAGNPLAKNRTFAFTVRK